MSTTMRPWAPLNPEHRIEDVTDLLEHGETPAVIADRLGLACGSLAKWLRKHGQPDLARVFEEAS